MRSYKATGVVLHTVKYGDNSLVVFMLTDLKGRASFMVRGVKSGRGGNKLALFQPMFVVEFEAVSSPKTQMDTIREVHSAIPLESLPFDIVKSTIALFMAEVLYRLVRDVEPESPLFEMVCNTVEQLDAAEQGVANFHLKFLVELSLHLGFYPSSDYREGDMLDIREGLFVNHEPSHGEAMSIENSHTLARFMTTDYDQLGSIAMNRTSRDAFLSAMLEYFDYHLDSVRNIRSIEILRTVFG